EAVILTLEESKARTGALLELGQALMQNHQWKRAETLFVQVGVEAQTIEEGRERAMALAELGRLFAQTHQWKQAEAVWEQAEAIAYTLTERREKTSVLRKFISILIQSQQWGRASAMIEAIDKSWDAQFRVLEDCIEVDDEETDSFFASDEGPWQTQLEDTESM